MHVGYEKWYALSGYANLSTYWFFSLLVLSYFLWQKISKHWIISGLSINCASFNHSWVFWKFNPCIYFSNITHYMVIHSLCLWNPSWRHNVNSSERKCRTVKYFCVDSWVLYKDVLRRVRDLHGQLLPGNREYVPGIVESDRAPNYEDPVVVGLGEAQ